MLRQVKNNSINSHRTHIEDISTVGKLLSEEHLRGISAGRVKTSCSPTKDGNTWSSDCGDETGAKSDTL
jgi:hypothetical protein